MGREANIDAGVNERVSAETSEQVGRQETDVASDKSSLAGMNAAIGELFTLCDQNWNVLAKAIEGKLRRGVATVGNVREVAIAKPAAPVSRRFGLRD